MDDSSGDKGHQFKVFILDIIAFITFSYFTQTHLPPFLYVSLSPSLISGLTDKAESQQIVFSPLADTNNDITFKKPFGSVSYISLFLNSILP